MAELDHDAGSGGDVRARRGRLLVSYPAADGLEFEAGLLSGFDGAADGLAPAFADGEVRATLVFSGTVAEESRFTSAVASGSPG